MDLFYEIFNLTINSMYTYVLIGWLLVTGIYFSIKTGFVQVRMLKPAFKALKGKKTEGMSSFQALMISTASRVGTGNIAGVASAIAIGGRGALFWMWITALLGSASAFIESTLAQVFKVKSEDGTFRGGPAYYIETGLRSRKMGILFAIILILTYAYGFNALQAFNMRDALQYYTGYSLTVNIILGIVLAGLLGAIIFGGVKRISFISSIVVPTMAIIYFILGLIVLVMNIEKFPSVFVGIFYDGLNFKAFAGGSTGTFIVMGIKRGLFSNEAGMGSAPNAAASADVLHPVTQGLVQVISVFIDTLLICSITALTLLLSDVNGGANLNGIPFVQQALYSQVGSIGIHIITIAIFLFAFSSLIGNYYYAESNILFIKDNKKLLFVFRISAVIAVFAGTLSSFNLAWGVADILMVFMTIINLIAIITLHPIAISVLRDYKKQVAAGKEPVFMADSVKHLDSVEHWQ